MILPKSKHTEILQFLHLIDLVVVWMVVMAFTPKQTATENIEANWS